MGDPLDAFCYHIVDRPGWCGRITPEAMAAQFVWYFRLPAFPQLRDVETVVLRSNLARVVSEPLPSSIEGCYVMLDVFYTISYRNDGPEWNKTYTLLHEVQEVLEQKLSFTSNYVPRWGRQRERRSDRFAEAVLMQPEVLAMCSRLRGKTLESIERKLGLPPALVNRRLAEVLDQCRISTESHDRYGRSLIYCGYSLPQEEEHWLTHPTASDLLRRMREKPFRIGGVYGSELWRLNSNSIVARQSLWRSQDAGPLTRVGSLKRTDLELRRV